MIRTSNRGFTLTETLLASVISVLAVSAGTAAFLTGTSEWAKGEIEMASEGSSNYAMRIISNQLREAMSVNVAADGLSIDYILPKKDGNGEFLFPNIPDGVARRFYFDGHSLMLQTGGKERVICRGILYADPRLAQGTLANEGVANGSGVGKVGGGTSDPGAEYKPFLAAPGALTREVTVKLVTIAKDRYGKKTVSSKREVVLARNVPRIF